MQNTIGRWLLCRFMTAVLLAVLAVTALPRSASAATLVEVSNFGRDPSNLRMFLYVPDNVRPHPAVLVAVHFCTGSGPVFFSGTEFASLANRHGFIVIYPSATRSGSCFDVSTAPSLTHNGSSDPVGIVSMVQHVVQNFGADASRVFVTGASSGAMMTNVLLGDYPDVFKAGAAFSGVPFGCFATNDGSLWNTTCANGQSIRTAQQWGDLARAAFPGFTGPRPRMQLWHGTEDATLRFPNFGEEIKQWTNVLGLSQTPAFTDHPQSTWTRTRYGGTGSDAPVEAISIQGIGHSLPLAGMAAMVIQFFGLDRDSGGDGGGGGGGGGGGSAGGTPTVTITDDWGTGFCATLTVTNNTTATITWEVAITVQGMITNLWNGTFTQSGSTVTVRGAPWNGTLPPGQSTSSVGFCAQG